MPLEQLLAMYGYSIPTEEGEDEEVEEEEEEVEEGVESVEGGGAGSGEEEEEGNSPPTTTSTNPSSPSPSPPPPPPAASSRKSSKSLHRIETSRRKSSKSKVDSKPTNIASSSSVPEQPDLVHDVIDDHDILMEEVEIEEHPASVLGKHPRSEEGAEPGDNAVYKDVMLSSRTALEGTCNV